MQKREATRAVSFKARTSSLQKIDWHGRPPGPGRRLRRCHPGRDRDALIERARQADTTAELNEWLHRQH